MGIFILKAIGVFFVCLWSADFLTGFFHWLEDTYCLESYPLIGGFICEPNIEHHVDPQMMVRTGTFISRNILQWTLALVLFAILCLISLGNVFTFITLLMTSFGNEVHRWNHISKNGKFVTFMKDFGIIQAQRQHSMHHKPPHKKYYCVLTSQVNAVLEPIDFWRKLEWFVQIATGISPKRANRRDSQPRKPKKKVRSADRVETKPVQA
jgi:ubiquitin-conjugating enzyme E2 variant